MEQHELENRVEDIFERQGFRVNRDGNAMEAERGEERKQIQAFSSENFTPDEVMERASENALVFVDENLEGIAEKRDVSVIREEREEEEYDLPSYELIGDIAVINELTVPEQEAVQGILEHHPHVETILLKDEPLSGEYRVGGYEKLHGDETETTHKEFGCRYRVDPTVAYFSERLATERKRIADLVEPGEKVLVIGAGVGPYPILIASESEPEQVVAVEKNPVAFDYLEENIELNAVENRVKAVEGDARKVELPGDFDRVVIAVPEFSQEFLPRAFEAVTEGGTIHYYSFLEDEEWEGLEQEVGEAVGSHSFETANRVVCGQRGPSVDRVCLDVMRK
ncbi:MAG: class I SAM-dependent methyltransferase family protein [Candidatus Nanohaloarchaea archaeon]